MPDKPIAPIEPQKPEVPQPPNQWDDEALFRESDPNDPSNNGEDEAKVNELLAKEQFEESLKKVDLSKPS